MSPSSDPDAGTGTGAGAESGAAAVREIAVVLPANLHARPAGQVARAAARFGGTVRLEYAGRTVNASGVLAVMGLGATAGTTVTVRAEGPDADRAVTELAGILAAAE